MSINMDYKNKKRLMVKSHIGHNTSVNMHQYNCADFVYICIKKEYFNVNMVYLNYYNLKKKKQIEIIYKSPSIFLEGVFLKTPEMVLADFVIYKHDKQNTYNNNNNEKYNLYSNIVNNTHIKPKGNNQYIPSNTKEIVDIKFYLIDSNPYHAFFINLLQTLDNYIIQYLDKYKTEIENELVLNYRDNRKLSEYKYINIIKHVKTYANSNTSNCNTSQNNKFEITMKSYLDKKLIYDFIKKKQRVKNLKSNIIDTSAITTKDNSKITMQEQKYIFTFNISNIYFGNTNLIPLIKTNNVQIF